MRSAPSNILASAAASAPRRSTAEPPAHPPVSFTALPAPPLRRTHAHGAGAAPAGTSGGRAAQVEQTAPPDGGPPGAAAPPVAQRPLSVQMPPWDPNPLYSAPSSAAASPSPRGHGLRSAAAAAARGGSSGSSGSRLGFHPQMRPPQMQLPLPPYMASPASAEALMSMASGSDDTQWDSPMSGSSGDADHGAAAASAVRRDSEGSGAVAAAAPDDASGDVHPVSIHEGSGHAGSGATSVLPRLMGTPPPLAGFGSGALDAPDAHGPPHSPPPPPPRSGHHRATHSLDDGLLARAAEWGRALLDLPGLEGCTDLRSSAP
eukprot:320909-Chlamydomonas_euryale.AAC.1